VVGSDAQQQPGACTCDHPIPYVLWAYGLHRPYGHHHRRSSPCTRLFRQQRCCAPPRGGMPAVPCRAMPCHRGLQAPRPAPGSGSGERRQAAAAGGCCPRCLTSSRARLSASQLARSVSTSTPSQSNTRWVNQAVLQPAAWSPCCCSATPPGAAAAAAAGAATSAAAAAASAGAATAAAAGAAAAAGPAAARAAAAWAAVTVGAAARAAAAGRCAAGRPSGVRICAAGRGSMASTLEWCSWKAGVTQAPWVLVIPGGVWH
jgi:hypothetical protein